MRARNASPAIDDGCFDVLPWRQRHGRRRIARAATPAVVVTLFLKLSIIIHKIMLVNYLRFSVMKTYKSIHFFISILKLL